MSSAGGVADFSMAMETPGGPSAAASGSEGGSGSGQSSAGATQITLAISQRDAVRMLDASRAFNEAIRSLQDEGAVPGSSGGGGAAGGNNDTGPSASSVGSTAKKDQTMTDGSAPDAASADQDDDVVMSDAGDGPEVSSSGTADAKKKAAAAGAAAAVSDPSAESPKPSAATASSVSNEQRSPSPNREAMESDQADVRTKPSPTRSDASGNSSSNNKAIDKAPLNKLLIPAAERCTDPFIKSYLRQMRTDNCPDGEIEACLLLFLDMDKSTKLLTAFGILGDGASDASSSTAAAAASTAMDCDEDGNGKNKAEAAVNADKTGTAASSNDQEMQDVASSKPAQGDDDGEEEIVVPGPLPYEALSTMLRCFLTSISSCIHRGDANAASGTDGMPPSKAAKGAVDSSPRSTSLSSVATSDYPWTMSSDGKSEITEIAKFAADRLADHARAMAKARAKALDTTYDEIDDARVSFEAFGDWYNSGGFKLVPWLELLDLAKWDYAGRAAAAAAAAAAKSDRHTQRREAAAASAGADPFMGVITEELLTGPLTPNVFLEGAGLRPLHPRPRQPPPRPSRSRTVVSFDFTGAMPSSQPFHIRITEGNLRMLKDLVTRTGLSGMSPDEISDILLRHAETNKSGKETCMVLTRDTFSQCISDFIPAERASKMGREEMDVYTSFFSNFFACFDKSCSSLSNGYVNAKELAVGFSFLCAGNKSTKLATAYELLDDAKTGQLCFTGLSQYLRSYLTMLVGISLLDQSAEKTAETRRMLAEQKRLDMFVAVENGSQWTRDQFIVSLEKKRKRKSDESRETMTAAFEDFAEWYTEGGYTVAPWLELLDLTKFLSLIGSNRQTSRKPYPTPAPQPTVDILFTFPLANHQSLVVLQEDATYVKSVVTQLSLSSMTPEQLWTALYGHIKKKTLPALPESESRKHRSGFGKSMDANQASFVASMEKIMKGNKKKNKMSTAKSADGISPKDTLKNFFQSFDMHQVDRVAANELMGGLTLLCGGKKSVKLAFAFGLFDGRPEPPKTKNKKAKKGDPPPPPNSLDGKELFLFLRSFLIVMFSCCKQSLDLSAEEVSRYIYDTAHVIAQDVMRFQWDRRKADRVNFDQFGEWYNEGGFETAPWLELLDLNKWVFSEDSAIPYRPSPQHRAIHHRKSDGDDVLGFSPPPPEDFLDPNDPFFSDDINMDGIDAMDFAMIAEDIHDKENVGNPPQNAPTPRQDGGSSSVSKSSTGSSTASGTSTGSSRALPSAAASSASASAVQQVAPEAVPPGAPVAQPPQHQQQQTRLAPAAQPPPQGAGNQGMMRPRPPPPPMHPPPPHHSQSLKFHLLTGEQHGGYLVSISQRRVRHLRQLVVDSGLCKIDGAAACSRIMESATKLESGPATLNRKQFDAAIRGVFALSKTKLTPETQQGLSDLLTTVFSSFDRSKKDEVSALEVAAGFTVLCGGRKSDKLEFAFDHLDLDKDGKLIHADMVTYLNSFLTVLLRVATSPALDDDQNEATLITMKGAKCQEDDGTIHRVIAEGSKWAVGAVYKGVDGGKSEHLSFDSFADWYTRGGYTSIPWLELLDLRKWCLAA